jgi:hypothetical protein
VPESEHATVMPYSVGIPKLWQGYLPVSLINLITERDKTLKSNITAITIRFMLGLELLGEPVLQDFGLCTHALIALPKKLEEASIGS